MTARAVTPSELAALTVAAVRPVLIGLDVDGVLAPIVRRADRAALLPGVVEVLTELATVLHVAVVSGRSVGDLEERYGFPERVTVVGSHGLELRSGPPLQLDDGERSLLSSLVDLAEEGAEIAGDGAWLEHKPASVVLHTREADPARAACAADLLIERAARLPGARTMPGHSVVELMARTTSKATAIEDLRRAVGAATVVFVGDDRTDEEVFASLRPGDLSVRVGPGASCAQHRLDKPSDVLAWLRCLVESLVPPA